MELSVDDLLVDTANAFRSFNYRIGRMQTTVGVSTYGKNAIDLAQVQRDFSDIDNAEQAAQTARFIIAVAEHASRLVEAVPEIAVALTKQPNYQFKHSGISTTWTPPLLRDFVFVPTSKFDELLDGFAQRQLDHQWDNALRYLIADKRLTATYTGNSDNSTLSRALWIAKRNQVISTFRDSWVSTRNHENGIQLQIETTQFQSTRAVPFDAYTFIGNAVNAYLMYRPNMHTLRDYRNDLIDDQASRQRMVDQQNRQRASEKFRSYWNTLKDNQAPQTAAQADADLLAVPLQAAGTPSSRTWGIEIETVRFNETSRPPGWDDKYDGSLPSDDSECSCDCDSCCDGEHCEDSDYSCYYDGGAEVNGSRELVSPILNSFNSNGLRQICEDLGTREDEHSAPGIHVHVGAADLSVLDVTRLLIAYSAVERLITPTYHRKTRGYCVETPTDTLRWWLAKAREYRHANPDSIPTAKDLLYHSSAGANSRYVDVNLQSLNTHGTIEFRSMGAWYSYDHLVRWAWLVREMVNVSKLGIDQSEWTSCRSMADVVSVLRKYGSEIPSSALVDDLKAVDLDLSTEEEQELTSVVG